MDKEKYSILLTEYLNVHQQVGHMLPQDITDEVMANIQRIVEYTSGSYGEPPETPIAPAVVNSAMRLDELFLGYSGTQLDWGRHQEVVSSIVGPPPPRPRPRGK